jgi:transglutaminase-like putative cysteine protease
MRHIFNVLVMMAILTGPVFGVINEDLPKIKELSDSIVKDCLSDGEKVLALSHFVNGKIHSNPTKGISPTAQMATMDRIDIGVGWCNHQVAVFMRLAEAQGIPTRMIYLLNNEGTESKHTIGEAFVGGKWVVVDPMFDFNFLATRHDIVKDISILKGKIPDGWEDYFLNPGIIAYELEANGKPQ